MRRLLMLAGLVAIVSCLQPSALATTTLRLHQPPSTVSGYQTMSLSLGPAGAAVTTSVTNTTAAGTSIQATQTGGGSVLAWMSEPFGGGGATLSGTETLNFYGKEAASANNASVQFQLFKYSGGSLGSVFCTGTWGTELTTSMATHAPTCAASSTAFSAGDQLVVKLFIVNCATSGCPTGTMGAGTPGVTVDYDGHTASSDGDTNIVLAESVTFNPYGGAGGTPTCSNWVDQIEPWNQTFTAAGNALLYLPNGAGSGNAIFVADTASSTDVLTVSDDKSNPYYLAAHLADGTNNQDIWLFYAPNVVAGTRGITIHHTTTDEWMAPAAFECTNVATAAPLDVSTGANANSNTVSAGSVTPNYSGDLFLEWYWNDYSTTGQATIVAGSQTNITWALGVADRSQSVAAQWGVYSSTSALNPQLTKTGNTGYAAVAAAFRSSTGGTAFPSSGIRITAVKTMNISSSGLGGQATLPRTDQFPCATSNNSLIAAWIGASPDTLTGVSDSNNGAWTQTAAAACDGGSVSCAHNYYFQNATTTPSQTVTIAGSAGNDSLKLLCVAGGSTASLFDKGATSSADQTVAGNISVTGVAPATSNGLIIGTLGVQTTTINGVSAPSGALIDSCLWNQQSVNPGGCDENNGWMHYANPNTTTVTPTWNEWTAVAAGWWNSRIDAFEAATAAQYPPPLFVIQP